MMKSGVPKPSEKPDLFTIHNKRYSIPADFIARHPGGVDAILLGRGRNCTELFESYHSLSDAPQAMLQKYYVEDAKPGDADYDDTFSWTGPECAFYTDLKQEVRKVLKKTNGGSFPSSYKCPWSKAAVLACFCFLCFLCGFGSHIQWNALMCMLLPVFYWMGPACMLHDGTHFALSSAPWVNATLARLGSYHSSPFAWMHQHVIGHHAHTNLFQRDPDLRAFEGSDPHTLYGHRLTPFAPYFHAYRRWLRSLFVTMPFSCIQPSIKQDANVWINGHYDHCVAVTTPPPQWRLVLHLIVRTIMWSALLVWPFIAAPSWRQAFFHALFPPFLYGCLYYVFSQVSHIQEDCFHPQAPRDWARHQCSTSLDWGVDSVLARYASIALNMQTVHHLFPQVDSAHYATIRPVLEAVATKHNIKLNQTTTIWQALKQHFVHIYSINRDGINEIQKHKAA